MDIKSSSVIYRLLYLTLHFVFTSYELLQAIYFRLRNKLSEIHHEFTVNKPRSFPKLAKIPNHVTVLLGAEQPSFHDLANLILWCLAAGIPFVSFYDHKGTLKKHEERLHRVVSENKRATDHVIWHGLLDFYKNGYTGRKVHVKVLSVEDGRVGVVELTKKLASGENTSISIDSFNEGLARQFEFPDPDLGVCCGKTFSLFGYPPWQIRVTEFLRLRSHHNLKFDDFVDLLCRYSKCEQRYGK